MEPIMFLLLSISLLGIFLMFGIFHFKIENNIVNHTNEGSHNFDSFMNKVKSNSSKIRR
jgi:hypothetical protein